MTQPVILTQTGVGIGGWHNLDFRANPFSVGINAFVTGAVTFSLETTNSDVLRPGTTINVAPTTIAGAAASSFLSLNTPTRWWRLNILTGAGSVTVEAQQAGY